MVASIVLLSAIVVESVGPTDLGCDRCFCVAQVMRGSVSTWHKPARGRVEASFRKGRHSVLSCQSISTSTENRSQTLRWRNPSVDHVVAFTCQSFQDLPVYDTESSARVADGAEFLQTPRHHRNTLPTAAHHVGNLLVRYQKLIVTDTIMG